jgi:hypothetical protein
LKFHRRAICLNRESETYLWASNNEMAGKKRSPSIDAITFPLEMTKLMLASGETVARRMLLISQNKCSPDEYFRMVNEKTQAAMTTGLTLMSSFGQASMTSLMAPWVSKATANAKRLRKK